MLPKKRLPGRMRLLQLLLPQKKVSLESPNLAFTVKVVSGLSVGF